MVVEAYKLLSTSLVEMLTDNGHEVVAEANRGAEAVEKVNEHKPELVLLDIHEDTFEATRQIKKDHPEVKVVMLSLAEDVDDKPGAIESGADAYIGKNATTEDLIDAINAVGEKRAA